MKVDSFKCDGCGIQKGETNHWYSVEVLGDHIEVWPQIFTAAFKHYCSNQCLILAMQQWLSAQKDAQ